MQTLFSLVYLNKYKPLAKTLEEYQKKQDVLRYIASKEAKYILAQELLNTKIIFSSNNDFAQGFFGLNAPIYISTEAISNWFGVPLKYGSKEEKKYWIDALNSGGSFFYNDKNGLKLYNWLMKNWKKLPI